MPPRPFVWPEPYRMAVSLTFDDGRPTQLPILVPYLAEQQVKASFYILPRVVAANAEGWRKVLGAGHEIGNHSHTHPCSGSHRWSRNNALEDYTLERIALDIDQASDALEILLGTRPETYAYPCYGTFVGMGLERKSYVPVVAERFVAGRSGLSDIANDPSFCDPHCLHSFELDDRSPESAVRLLENAYQDGRWGVFTSHEVAPEPVPNKERYSTTLATLDAVVQWCRSKPDVWIDTVATVARSLTTL